jgi:hypothetical protein
MQHKLRHKKITYKKIYAQKARKMKFFGYKISKIATQDHDDLIKELFFRIEKLNSAILINKKNIADLRYDHEETSDTLIKFLRAYAGKE